MNGWPSLTARSAAAAWDEMTDEERLQLLVSQAGDQLQHLVDRTRFFDHPTYRRHCDKPFGGFDAFDGVPIQHGKAVRQTPPPDLLPADPVAVYRSHGTGGTTGQSMDVLDTRRSWETSVHRMASVTDVAGVVAFNAYNKNHITHEILSDVVLAAGGTPRSRALNDDPETMLQRMRENDCTMLIAPGSTPEQDKGSSVVDLWEADTDGYIAEHVDRVWYSSTPLPNPYRRRLADAGITVEGFFGNTEVRAFGYAPPAHPQTYHLLEGQYLVLGMDDDGTLQRNGADLRLLVSAVAASDGDGGVARHDGSGFFLYETGDRATIRPAGPCPVSDDCGLTTPTLEDIRRVERIEEKLQGGCQVG